MRLVIASLMTMGLLAFATASMPTVAGGGYVVSAQEQPQPQQPQQPQQEPQQPRQDPQQPQQQSQQPSGEINVDINSSSSAWWTDPVWIGAGVVALLALIAIVAMASRSGGTTIVRG